MKYNPSDFVKKLQTKCPKLNLRTCPFCGGNDFTTTENFASILVRDDILINSLGPNIPSGMIICKNCGHIDFFALGALNLLPAKDENDAKK
ncbi:MAG: hypothetical protein IKN03_06790 [Fibrobacter sp.]|nr:hypothetical protein [Fibrobacter sp.]